MFVLAVNGDVRELSSDRRVLPRTGRKYSDEARLFAVNDRWLELPDGLIDLTVERPLLQSPGIRHISHGAVGWALAARYESGMGYETGYKFWLLPEHPDTIPTDDLLIWAELLACGELGPDGQFRALDEAEWDLRRLKLVASTSTRQFQFPGIDVNDRLYWLRNASSQSKVLVLLDRLIAQEPTFRNYVARARRRHGSKDYVGSLSDWLAAEKLSRSAARAEIGFDANAAFSLVLQANRPRSEYDILLAWSDRRLSEKTVGFRSQRESYVFPLVRGLALFRLDRFADTVKQLQAFKIGKDGEYAEAVLIRAMARKRLGQTAAAQDEYKTVIAAMANRKEPEYEGLLAEAEKLFCP